jgi:hypothetical protein
MESRAYKECYLCGNDSEEELNIEGRIHHNIKVRCFDQKACKKRCKKEKRKNKRRQHDG